MNSFNNNRNTLASLFHTLKNDFHAFISLGISKGTRNDKQQKKTLVANISNAIESIDTNDCGIRIIVLKTKN
jgi:hypothetical protein